MSAKRNSFQAAMNASSPLVAMAGPSSGTKMRQTTPSGVAPSISAASSSSRGSWAVKMVSTHTVKGSVNSV